MITEDYVSFEISKLLKKKGFHELCHYNYHCDGFFYQHKKKDYNGKNYEKLDSEWYSAPSLAVAMKWLREEHNLHCNSDYDIVLGWYCQITSLNETVEYDYEEMKHYHPAKDNGFSSPEEACEAAIKYCLTNLI